MPFSYLPHAHKPEYMISLCVMHATAQSVIEAAPHSCHINIMQIHLALARTIIRAHLECTDCLTHMELSWYSYNSRSIFAWKKVFFSIRINNFSSKYLTNITVLCRHVVFPSFGPRDHCRYKVLSRAPLSIYKCIYHKNMNMVLKYARNWSENTLMYTIFIVENDSM